jgi:hypothetical protein
MSQPVIVVRAGPYFTGRTPYRQTRRRLLAAAPAFALQLCREWLRVTLHGSVGEQRFTATS